MLLKDLTGDAALAATIAALADMTADDNEEGEAESREVEEPPPPGSPLTLLARKAKGDVGTLRKIVRNDFNTLELQLLRGDPTLSAARDLLQARTWASVALFFLVKPVGQGLPDDPVFGSFQARGDLIDPVGQFHGHVSRHRACIGSR